MREEPLLDAHHVDDVELEALGRVHRHQPHRVVITPRAAAAAAAATPRAPRRRVAARADRAGAAALGAVRVHRVHVGHERDLVEEGPA